MPEAWSSTAKGLHVPVTPFEDVAGNDGTVSPAQMVSDVPKLKEGICLGVTVTEKLADVAHCPAVGVKV
jgi:hypothetical protein